MKYITFIVGKIMKAFTFFVLLLFSISVCSQELHVKSFGIAESDLSAQTQPRKDLNDKNCALVKVGIGLQGVQFEGNVVGNVVNKVGEYWVYIPQGSRMLKVKHSDYSPVLVVFANYGVDRLEGNRTYDLSLTARMVEKNTFKLDNLFKKQYDALLAKAESCYNKKDYKAAKTYYEEILQPEFKQFVNSALYDKIALCDTILFAQRAHNAITKELATVFNNISSYSEPIGFSEGVMVVDYGYGNVDLITKEGNKMSFSRMFLEWPKMYSEDKLAVSLDGKNCFLSKAGTVINNRNSDYESKLKGKQKIGLQPFYNGLSIIYNRNNGKRGLLNEFGQIVLPLSDYKGIWVLKDKIIFASDKQIYKYSRVGGQSEVVKKKYICKIFDYNGYVRCVNEDYILIENNKKCSLFAFDKTGSLVGQLYTFESDRVKEYSPKLVMCKINEKYFLYNFLTEERTDLDGYLVGNYNNLHFDGKKCYDTEGNLKFIYPQKILCATAGYSGGFLLVCDKNTFYYIDEFGKKLINSEFYFSNDKAKELFSSGFRKPFSEGFGLIMKNGKWGLIDRFGNTTFDYL